MSIILDGTNGITHSAGGSPQTLGATLLTPQNTTSGTSIDFSVPSGVKRVTLTLSGVSTSGSSQVRVRLGPSGGVETSGYFSVSSGFASGVGSLSSTAGFDIHFAGQDLSGAIRHGSLIFTLSDSSTNLWAVSGVLSLSNIAYSSVIGGAKALASALSIVRLTTVNGTDTFDAGSANVLYE